MLNIISQAPLNLFYFDAMYPSDMTIGARLRQLRLRNGLSGDKLGELCDVTKGMVSQWESDTVTPPTDRLLLLHKHLNFSFDWLLNGETVYSTTNPKIGSAMQVMEQSADYVQEAAVSAVLTTCELAKRAKANGTHN